MPKVRRRAVNDVWYRGFTYEQTALKYGVTKSAICKWVKRASPCHKVFIPTKSARPHSHPNQLSCDVVERIVSLRGEIKRCAPVLTAHLEKEGIRVSVSSVARTLKRQGLTRKPKPPSWKTEVPRPISDSLGALVEADTMHVVKRDYSRFYVYAVLDTFSRLGYAEYQTKANQTTSIEVVERANRYFGFPFRVIQTDNGPEFRNNFAFYLRRENNILVRYSRIRKPNDNAHIERFIRTLQDECLGAYPKEETIQKKLTHYIEYYNHERLHLSLNMQSPREFVSKLLN